MDPISYLQQVHHSLAKRKFFGGLQGFRCKFCKAICKISPRYLSSEIWLHSQLLLDPAFLKSSFNLLFGAFSADLACLCWRLWCLCPSSNRWLRRFHDLALGFPFSKNIQTVHLLFVVCCSHLTFLFFFLYLLISEWMF